MIFDEQLSTMSLPELRELEGKLSMRIKGLVNQEKQEAINKVRALIDTYGIDMKTIFGRKGSSDGQEPSRKVAPKYRDPETGNTWTGRGKAPKWLSGKSREDFRIKSVIA